MKVFVARAPEAPEPDDFHFALDGELVTLPQTQCCNPDCGCDRSMAGLISARATTSFTVTDLDMSFEDYADALREGLRHQGWWDDEEDDEWLLEDALELHLAALPWAVGTPLRIRDGLISPRPTRPASWRWGRGAA
ncbi:MAG: DUF7715 family protein [Ilumatobacteraceae bacterium]|jgi:hypothetical protein